MLALENCRAIVRCGSGAHFSSFLARDIRDGRLGVPVNRYTARLLVEDANNIIARFGPPAPIYLHKGDVWTTTIEAAATIIPGMLRSGSAFREVTHIGKILWLWVCIGHSNKARSNYSLRLRSP